MLDIISITLTLTAIAILLTLAVIDLRVRLLPNIAVLGLALSGFAFHASTLFFYAPVQDLMVGAFIGGGTLYMIRLAGNMAYKSETLGLGDVKLMAAGGLWLGSYFILPALIIGAIAGIIHGVLLMAIHRYKTKEFAAFSTFSLPAGPGFAAGLFIAALAKFSGLPHLLP